MLKSGLENLIENPPDFITGRRLGLLANPASVGRDYTHARDIIAKAFPGQLKALFSPQHGFFAEKQDNMIESKHSTDEKLDIPVYSLYGETRIPTEDMLKEIDVLLIDLQDVGTRVYTFIHTISLSMQAAKKAGVICCVLDRPNPISGLYTEGNVLEEEYSSFVGLHPIPMRHGLSIGEYAMMINKEFKIETELKLIPMQGWRRDMFFKDTGLPWVLPSPNMPDPETALVYPGQVIWEGSILSEGRGTTRPFHFFGAPWLDSEKMVKNLPEDALRGSFLRRIVFEPTSGKYQGRACSGFEIHPVDLKSYKPYYQSLCLLQAIIKTHPEEFAFKPPPYEYEREKLPMDLILGSRKLRESIEEGKPVSELRKEWEEGLKLYRHRAYKYLMYGPEEDFLN